MESEVSSLGTGRTGGRAAAGGTIAGRYALSVGKPDTQTPPGWSWRLLTDVAALETGHTPSRRHPEYWDGDIPWLGIKDANEHHGRTIDDTVQHVTQAGLDNSSARLLPAGTVCLSRTASIGFITRMGRPMATSQDFVNWICGPELDERFLMYVLLADRDSLFQFAHGSTHQTIYFPEVKAFHICLPPLPAQQAIAEVLGSLDDKIELNRRMNRTLESMARALFKSWFVDFDPVHANAAGNPTLPPDLAALFPAAFAPSPLGDIPVGWEVKTLADVLEIRSGGTPARKKPEYWNGDIPWFSVKDAPADGDVWVIETEEQTTEAGIRNSAANMLPLRTTIISARGTVGKLALTGVPIAMNQSCYGLVATSGCPPYYKHFLTQQFVERLQQISHGGVFDTITKQTFAAVDAVVPPATVAAAFEDAVTPLLEKQQANLRESRTLAAVRDALLPKLLGGALPVTEVAA